MGGYFPGQDDELEAGPPKPSGPGTPFGSTPTRVPETAAAAEARRRREAVALAEKMSKQAHANVGSLRSAYGASMAAQENAGVQGRRQIHQLSGLAVAGGGNQGLRGNIAGAVDAAKQGQIATAGFEAQQAGIMGNLATTMATDVGQAETSALEQDQNVLERKQQLKAGEGEALVHQADKYDTLMEKNPQHYFGLEIDEGYALRLVEIGVKNGSIPDNDEAKFAAVSYFKSKLGV